MGLALRLSAFVWALGLSVGVAQEAEISPDPQPAPEGQTAVVADQVVDERVYEVASPAPPQESEPAEPYSEPQVPEATTVSTPTASAVDEGESEELEELENDDEANTWERVSEGLRLDLGLTYSTFEQQVKSEVGGVSVEPIVEDRSFGLALTATYGIWKYIRLGVFFQLDMGSRFSARYTGLDASGTPIISGRIGGSYREFWMGPLLRVQWKGIAAEFGYGAFGVRSDDARDDLPTAAGETGALRTSPRIAWHAALSGYVPVHPHVDVVFRVQYRVRYYDRRSGESLANGVVHGTQNLTPTIGVSWRL